MKTQDLNYNEPTKLSREAAIKLLSSEKPEDVENALVSIAFYDGDLEFVLKQLISHAQSSSSAVRGTAILCLGHVARLHRSIPIEPTVAIIKEGLADTDEYVRGQAHSAAEDIKQFVLAVGYRIRES